MQEYLKHVKEAVCAIEEAAGVALDNDDVMAYLKQVGTHEETYRPEFWVIDYISQMFKE